MSRAGRVRSWATTAVKVVVTVALLGYVLRDVSLAAVGERIAAGQPAWLLAALAVLLAQVAAAGLRWRLVASALHRPMRAGSAMGMTFIGHFFNQVLPTTVGGDVVRGWLAYRGGMPAPLAATGLITDRLSALVMVLLVMLAAIPHLRALGFGEPALATVGLLAAGGLAGFGSLLLFDGWRRLAGLPALRAVSALSRACRRVFLRFPVNLAVLALGAASVTLTGAAVHLLARSLGLYVPPHLCVLLMTVVALLMMAPVTLAGWGLRELAMVEVMGQVGVPRLDALALSVIFGLLGIVGGIPGAVLWLRTTGRAAFAESAQERAYALRGAPE